MEVRVTIERKHAFYIIFTMVALSLIGYAFAQTPNPGHPATDIGGLGALAAKDSISWSEITGIPSDIADGDQDTTANTWTSEETSCVERYTEAWNTWLSCPAGYAVTRVWFSGAGITFGHIMCCRIR